MKITNDPALRAIEGSLHDICKFYGGLPGCARRDDDELVLMDTRIPAYGFNAVVYCNFADNADLRIAEIARDFECRKLPLMWWTTPLSAPDDIAERLEKAGFEFEHECPGMYIPMSEVDPDIMPRIEGLRIEFVDSQEKLKDWVKVLSEVQELTFESIGKFMEVEIKAGYEPDSPFLRWVGYIDGAPVCTSALFTGRGVPGIYYVVTLDEFRGRGLGRAITAVALLRAHEAGHKICVLQSSQMGYPLYKKMGFREKCKFHQYILPEKPLDLI
ncbi:MAG: GNAT family N-acetyltransferase [Candidatus Kapaibacterium sp.]